MDKKDTYIYPQGNAYWNDPRPSCRVCGKHFYPEDGIDEVMCEDCYEESFTFDMGKQYVLNHATDFFEWRYDISYRENSNRKELDRIFFQGYFTGHVFKDRDLRRYDEDTLKDYCRDVDKEQWTRFVLKERDL